MYSITGSTTLTVALVLAVLVILVVAVSRKKQKTGNIVAAAGTINSGSAEGIPVADGSQSNTTVSNPMMKRCPVCGKEIAKTAKVCPGCGAKNKKPIYRRGWVILVIIIAIAGIVIGINKNAGASKITFADGNSFTASELKKSGNDTFFIGARCTVLMTVKDVDSEFNIIHSKDGVEINYRYAHNGAELQTLALRKGNVIEVKGKINFIGTWQIEVDDITSIEVLS